LPNFDENGTGVRVSATDAGTDPGHPDAGGEGFPDGIEANSQLNLILSDSDVVWFFAGR
jgi:hypothetical protein